MRDGERLSYILSPKENRNFGNSDAEIAYRKKILFGEFSVQ